MQHKIVSIIIPCYNGEKTLERCLDSVLHQTYQNMEVIIVNDGSTDSSEEIILAYKKKVEETEMKIVYIKQENKGLAGAINGGLAVFSGDYLCWIDCDDYLFPTSVEKRIKFLEENNEIAVVTSDAYFYEENDLENPIGKASDGKPDLYNANQFLNHLRGDYIFCCGCHMLRADAFLDVCPTRKIYPARRGQNWQMLLPVYYKYKQAFFNEPLYAYIQYSSSMSAGDINKEQYKKRYDEHLDIIVHTLAGIEMSSAERKKYLDIYKGIYERQLFYLGVSFHDYMMILNGIFKMMRYHELKISDFKWMVGLIGGKLGGKKK